MQKHETIKITFHPRAFSAFGADLVTNDCVAIAELVKNSYDAFAHHVTVNVSLDAIEVIDDGLGMTEEIIRNAWAVVATPYKENAPTVTRDGKTRRVSGNKGLGRFSAARLGNKLTIITRSEGSDFIQAEIDWNEIVNSENLSDCGVELTTGVENKVILTSGTIIRITELNELWGKEKIHDLENTLARLISPFEELNDFTILLKYGALETPVEIQPHDFIKHPPYVIRGSVSSQGTINWEYCFSPRRIVKEKRSGTVSWEDAQYGFKGPHVLTIEKESSYLAGGFSFEIRAWDLDKNSIGDVSDTFNIGKQEIRNSISQYRGLSVYRDGVLVLPKSDASKDWLGMDIRRVSAIGKRLSTSQIIGIVNISSDINKEIRDTTDREKLVDTNEYHQFCRVVETILVILENEKYKDKTPEDKRPRGMSDLILPLSASGLVAKVEEATVNGESPDAILNTVRDYAAENEKVLQELNLRLTFYAQTASLGSVAIVILHEILTGMTVIKRFLNRCRTILHDADAKTIEYLEDSERSHQRLIDVANSFAPLYRRSLRSEKHTCNLNKEIDNSIRLVSSKKAARDVRFETEYYGEAITTLYGGELQTVLINLLDNALYWVQYANRTNKLIKVTTTKREGYIFVEVSDTGVGINADDAYRIFEPGITSKPQGIGMGLVIVTEILNDYNCKIATIIPGRLGGATFEFTVPVAQ